MLGLACVPSGLIQAGKRRKWAPSLLGILCWREARRASFTAWGRAFSSLQMQDPAELWQRLSTSVLQGGRDPGRQGERTLPGARWENQRRQEGEIISVCLAPSLLACQGRGDRCETFALHQKNLPFIPLFIFLGAKQPRLMLSPSRDF